MIRKLTEAGYIGFFLTAEEHDLTVLRILWGCVWFIAVILGIIVMITLVVGHDYYEDKTYYKDTIPNFIWSGALFSLSVYFCLGFASVFKWTLIFLTLAWAIKTWLNLKKVYTYFNRHSQSYVVGETTVDFKTIKNLYQVSPYRLRLPKYYQNNFSWDNCLYKFDPKANQIGTYTMQLILPNFYEFFKFYIWDYCENKRYTEYEARKQRVEDIEANKKNLEIIIAQAQADIDVLKARAKEEIGQANEMMDAVKKGMKKT